MPIWPGIWRWLPSCWRAPLTGGVQLAVLPENFALMGRRDGDALALREVEGRGAIQDFLAEQAARHRLWLVGGTIPLAAPGETRRARAACLLFDDRGRQAGPL